VQLKSGGNFQKIINAESDEEKIRSESELGDAPESPRLISATWQFQYNSTRDHDIREHLSFIDESTCTLRICASMEYQCREVIKKRLGQNLNSVMQQNHLV